MWLNLPPRYSVWPIRSMPVTVPGVIVVTLVVALVERCCRITFWVGSTTPVVGSSSTKPAWATPLTVVNSPPTASLPFGRALSALTLPLNVGRNVGTKAPVATSNAAR